jgi:hypothetical protein
MRVARVGCSVALAAARSLLLGTVGGTAQSALQSAGGVRKVPINLTYFILIVEGEPIISVMSSSQVHPCWRGIKLVLSTFGARAGANNRPWGTTMTRRILPLIGLLTLVSSGAVAQELVVTATGVVTSDSDSSGIFGFGISPTPSGCGFSGSPCVSTAAGQPVVMTFTLDLSRTPIDACANNGCFTTQRYYPFTNTVPGTSWITTTDSIGGITVPEFAPNGGNVGCSTSGCPHPTSTNPYGASVAMAQTWLPGSLSSGYASPYNELDLQSTQVVQITGANGAYAALAETSFLRIDDATATPFLSALSLDQDFSWSSNLDDGASIAQIYRAVTVGTCPGGYCAGTQIVNAEANVTLESVTGKFMSAPEIDPASSVSGLTLLLGGLIVLRGRRVQRADV